MYIKITGYVLQVFSLGSYLYRLFLDFPVKLVGISKTLVKSIGRNYL